MNKEKVLNIWMMVATIPLIILSILGVYTGMFLPVLVLGLPFMILGIIILVLKNKQYQKKENI